MSEAHKSYVLNWNSRIVWQALDGFGTGAFDKTCFWRTNAADDI